MADTISASVGAGGVNTQPDVKIIQTLLNQIPAAAGGPDPDLVVDGLIGNKTITAIKNFQTRHGLVVDGRVDPGQATLARLNSLQVEKITFWIKAFIPGSIDGLTSEVPNHPGTTMIKGPFRGVSDCFHTDNRGFSDDPAASARMHSGVTIDFSGPNPQLSGVLHRCSPTIECDCEDGDEECNKSGDTSRMGFTLAPASAGRTAVVTLEGASNNPCVAGSPDIDYRGSITIQADERSVEFDGFVDVFPAFEAYSRINNNPSAKLFTVGPKPGATPWNLPDNITAPAGGNRPVHVVLRDEDGDGSFEIRQVFQAP
jgi:hypothetical protein